MESVNQYINESIHNSIFINEFVNIEAERMINEAFQSSLLTSLASIIKKTEAGNLDVSQWNPKKSFTSIFGPKVFKDKYKTTRLKSIKWSEIKDSDFQLYEEKPLKKLLKEIREKKTNYALIISCEPGTKNIKAFFNGLGTAPFKDGSYTQEHTDVLYTIGSSTRRHYNYDEKGYSTGYTDVPYTKVMQRQASKGKYKIRPQKADEIFEIIRNYDNYVLVLTKSMFDDYKSLTDEREESQKGIVYCDPESLKQLAAKQKARYNALVKEIKEKKLIGKDKDLFNEIKETQNEINDLIEQIMKSDSFDKFYDLDDALRYINYAYNYYVKYFSSMSKSKKTQERAAQRGEDYDEKWDFDKSSAKENISDAEEYLQKTKKYIEELKKEL